MFELLRPLLRLVPACLLIIAGSFASGDVQAAARPPNILVILADDLGYGDLGCYGASDMRTPHIDALARRGMRFQNFYANCPVCSPTRAALLSGRYPDRVGVPGVIRTHPENDWGFLATHAKLLPDVLREQGYRTAIVGKWHLGLESPNTPNERGFNLFHGYLGDMMDDYVTHRRHDINYMRRNDREIDPSGHATDLFAAWASDYLKQQRPDQPFFLYLAFNAPHTPIQPPAEWLERVKQREAGISDKRAGLVALIEHMDDAIGRVLKTLADAGLEENTLVVFTSDNGGQISVGANNGALRAGKGTMYEGGLKVPAIVAWPGTIEAGTSTEMAAMTMDLYSTLAESAGAAVPAEIEGRSFLPTLRGKMQPALREQWYFIRREGGPEFAGKTIEALRRGDWKLVLNSPFGPLELFNLKEDPTEAKNVIEQNRPVARELIRELQREIQAAGGVPWQKPAVATSGDRN